jgi:hypothetical protein
MWRRCREEKVEEAQGRPSREEGRVMDAVVAFIASAAGLLIGAIVTVCAVGFSISETIGNRTTKLVLDAHPPDHYAGVRLDLRPPSPRTQLPTPIRSRLRLMTASMFLK